MHDFGSGTDGALPDGALAACDGVLYGTTESGGNYGVGTLFSMTTSGTENVLHSFGHSSEGASTGRQGGCGMVFKLAP